jgi:hypothetical protein
MTLRALRRRRAERVTAEVTVQTSDAHRAFHAPTLSDQLGHDHASSGTRARGVRHEADSYDAPDSPPPGWCES